MKKISGLAVGLSLAATFAITSLAIVSPAALAQSVTSTPVSSVLVYVTTTTTVYTTPSTTGFTEGTLFAGQTWFAIGQNSTGDWIQIQIPSNSGFASWVPASTLALNGVKLPITYTATSVPGSTATAAPSATLAASTTAVTSPNASVTGTTTVVPPTVNPQATISVPFLTTVITTTTVYTTPSTSGYQQGTLFAGQTWFVLGKDATGQWIQVQIPSNSGLPGWVPASTLAISGLNIPLSPLVTPITPSAVGSAIATTPTATSSSLPTLILTSTPTA